MIAHLAEQLGHGSLGEGSTLLQLQIPTIGNSKQICPNLHSQTSLRFGWSMLLVLSAPPSTVDILDFTDNGVKGCSSDLKTQS